MGTGKDRARGDANSGGGQAERLRDIGEEELVRRLVARLDPGDDVATGPGDDCAVIDTGAEELFLFKTDCLVEGVHFLAGTEPELVGRKAIHRVLSDVAAMAGRPGHALVTLASDGDREVAEVEGWYEGLNAAAIAHGCAIVGGECTSLPSAGAVLSVALTGTVPREWCLRRSGARVGDRIVVTGRLGGSFESGRHLSFEPRIREAQWLAENAGPTAMMDLSDGLGSDLPRLAEASGTGYRVDLEFLPCHEGIPVEKAIAEGEDYELLFTLPPDSWASLRESWGRAFPDLPVTVIGEITERTEAPVGKGWEHYSKR